MLVMEKKTLRIRGMYWGTKNALIEIIPEIKPEVQIKALTLCLIFSSKQKYLKF